MLLFLNDIAGSEIALILVFILIFFGSKSIPGIARTMGRTMRQIKDASQDVQNEIKKTTADIRKDMNLKGMVDQTVNDIRTPLDQYADDINEALRPQSTPYSRTKASTVNTVPVVGPEAPLEVKDSPEPIELKENTAEADQATNETDKK